MKIFSILKIIINPKLIGYIISKVYIRWYEKFSYNFKINGEEHLLKSLPHEEIKVIFDVGSNVGDWTKMAFTSFNDATIHTFEISNNSFIILQKNFFNKKQIILNNYGLSKMIGKVNFKDFGNSEKSELNTIIDNSDFNDKKLKSKINTCYVTTGDIYCEERNISNIDLLKIDVEGAEHYVLEGFAKMLKKKAIKVIQFEYGYNNGDVKFLIKDFYLMLKKYGYVIGPLKQEGVIFMNFEYGLNDFNSGPNYVAVLEDNLNLIKKISGKKIKGYPRLTRNIFD